MIDQSTSLKGCEDLRPWKERGKLLCWAKGRHDAWTDCNKGGTDMWSLVSRMILIAAILWIKWTMDFRPMMVPWESIKTHGISMMGKSESWYLLAPTRSKWSSSKVAQVVWTAKNVREPLWCIGCCLTCPPPCHDLIDCQGLSMPSCAGAPTIDHVVLSLDCWGVHNVLYSIFSPWTSFPCLKRGPKKRNQKPTCCLSVFWNPQVHYILWIDVIKHD